MAHGNTDPIFNEQGQPLTRIARIGVNQMTRNMKLAARRPRRNPRLIGKRKRLLGMTELQSLIA